MTGEPALPVVQTLTGQRHAGQARHLAAAVVDICHIKQHPSGTADQTALAIVQGVTDQMHNTLANQLTIVVVELLRLDLEVLFAGNLTAAVIEAGGGDMCTPISHHHTTLVLHFAVNAQTQRTQATEHAIAVIQAANPGVDAVG